MGNVCDDLSQSFSWSSQKRSQSNPIGTLFTRSIGLAQHSRQACSSTIMLVFRSVFMDLYELSKASVAGIWPIWALKVVYYGSRGSFWADFEIFQILGGAGDIIYNSISKPKY